MLNPISEVLQNQITDKSLCAARRDMPYIQKQIDDADKLVKAKIRERERLIRLYEIASKANEEVRGVCLQVSYDKEGRWVKAHTLAEDKPWRELSAELKPKPESSHWIVMINEYGGEERAAEYFSERWIGGSILGMDKSWSYEQARKAAETWLTIHVIPV